MSSVPRQSDASPVLGDGVDVAGVARPDEAALNRLSKPELIELVVRYAHALDALTRRVNHLEGILAKNSRNSSKPPSSDQRPRKPAPAPKLDDGVQRKPGGQPGHKGHALKRVVNKDFLRNRAISITSVKTASGFFPQ